MPLPDDSPFVSCGSAAFTSASAVERMNGDSSGGTCEKAGGADGSGSVTRTFANCGQFSEVEGGKYSEENGGGL